MKTLFLVLIFLTHAAFAQNPSATTESGVNAPDFSDCGDCARVLNDNPVNAQGEELVINWELVQSRYSFNSLSPEDKAALLQELGPGERETLAERSERLNIKPLLIATGKGDDTIQDRMSGGLGRKLGLGDGTKVKVKVGKNKFMLKYEKKF